MLAGVRNMLMISTAEDTPRFARLLGHGPCRGLSLPYAVQPSPGGLAQACIIGRDFTGAASRVQSREEKPKAPKARYAVTGLHVCDTRAADVAAGLKIVCPEAIAFRLGYIDADGLERPGNAMAKNDHGQYLPALLREPLIR